MLSEENQLRAIMLAAVAIGFVLGGFSYYQAWSMDLVPAKECYMYRSDQPDVKVYGNCQTLQNITTAMTPTAIKYIEYENEATLTTLPTTIICDPTPKEAKETAQLLPTACQVCPTCPQCPKIDLEDIRTARPDCENSLCQQGYFRMKKRCLIAVGFTAPKYNEGPKIDEQPPGELNHLNEKVCFNWDERGYSFNMNISTWHMENRTIGNTTMYHFNVLSRENGS
jgi:hypothetical protein